MRLESKHVPSRGCKCVISTGNLSTVLAARAETKKEHAPLLSQGSSIMTGKVIDYTPRRAERAGQGPLQKSRYGGWQKQAVPHQPPQAHLSRPLINLSRQWKAKHFGASRPYSGDFATPSQVKGLTAALWNLPSTLRVSNLVSLFMTRVFRQMLTSVNYKIAKVSLELSNPSRKPHHVCIIQPFNISFM